MQINIGTGIVNYPMPVALIGTRKDDIDNFMTAAWISMVSHTPPRIAITLGKHLTSTNIHETGVFSVCFPFSKDISKADYCGTVSGARINKSNIFSVFTDKTGAPMITECGLNVECRLHHIDKNGMNETFIGDIVSIYADETALTDGRIDFTKFTPLILSQMDTRYYSLGKNTGKAWNTESPMD